MNMRVAGSGFGDYSMEKTDLMDVGAVESKMRYEDVNVLRKAMTNKWMNEWI